MSTMSRDKTVYGHLAFGLGDHDRDRVNDARSNSVVDDDEVNRLPGSTST